MPICRMCGGEYDAVVPPSPVANASAGNTAPGSPPPGPRLCLRCGGDVSAWEQLETTLADFIVWEGGMLAMLPAAATLVVWLFWVPQHEWGNYFPTLTFVCLSLCALVFFLIYDSRWYWWEHRWAGQIYRVSRMSLDGLIAITAVAGVLLSPVWVLYYTTVGRPAEFGSKLLFASIYVPAFVCLTAAVTLAVVSEYVKCLERYAAPPIFVNTNRLLQVVVKAAISDINLPELDVNAPTMCADTPAVYEVLQTLRIPENGGIHVLLREFKCVEYPSDDGKKQKKSMEMLWRIQADRWGRLQELRPGSLEPFSGENRVFRQIGRYSY